MPFSNSSGKSFVLKAGDCLDKHVLAVKGSAPKLEPRREPLSENYVIIAPTLEVSEKAELLDLLNEYRICFALNDYELGCTHLLEMDIEEKPGSQAVYSKPYKASTSQKKSMQIIVNEWKNAGLVTETSSSYRAPAC